MGMVFLFEMMKMFWKLIVVMTVKLCDYSFKKNTEFYTLKW